MIILEKFVKAALNWFKNNSRTIALEKFLKIVLGLFKNFQELNS